MKNEKNIFIIIVGVAFCIVFSTNIYNSVQSYKYRRLCDQYRKQLTATENTNKELTDRIGRITKITGRIKETTDANITDSRGIIESVESLRTQIQELENICYDNNSIDNYYNYWDNEFQSEGLMD